MRETYNPSRKEIKEKIEGVFMICYDCFEQAAAKGVHSAYFYLGLLNQTKSKYMEQDHEKGLDYFIKGAA